MYQSLSELKDLMGRFSSGVNLLGLKEGHGLVDTFFRADEGGEVYNQLLWCQERGIDDSRLSVHKVLPQREFKSPAYFEKLSIKNGKVHLLLIHVNLRYYKK